MKICLKCRNYHSTSDQSCPSCGHQPEKSNGFIAYAPELEKQEEGYKSDYYDDYASVEEDHFWFKARRDLIIFFLKRYAATMSSFLEIGCGTGYVMAAIKKEFPNRFLCGSEMLTSALMYASSKNTSIDLIQMDAKNIPYRNEFDCIGAFDVLEHIKEDETVLKEAFSALTKNGKIILTVPQHTWLWSAMDDYACHERRYEPGEMEKKLETAGFKITRSTSFMFFLLPAMALSRFMQKDKTAENYDTKSEVNPPKLINILFYLILKLELLLIKTNINFPAGGTRLIIAHKHSMEDSL